MLSRLKWWCCCKRCWSSASSSKEEVIDDDTDLVTVPQSMTQRDNPIQPFYVPRRHSSYNTGSFNPVFIQPRTYNSDSCSSSGDEEGPPIERGRCWSTVAATTPKDVAALVAQRDVSPTRSLEARKGNNVSFDRHVLSEIAEMEPALYQIPEGSRHDEESLGNLIFTTTFDEQEQRLTVFLERASALPVKGSLSYYDTFVKLLVTSSRKNFRLSRTIRKTLNPTFEEEFVIHMSRAKWKSSRPNFLRLSLYDSDRQGRHDAIGHVTLPISQVIAEKIQNHNMPLTPMTLPLTNLGQVLLGMAYSATQSRLSIHVIKARHLRLDQELSKCNFRPLTKDSYDTSAKVTLMCGGQKVKTTKSGIVTDSTDPMYSHKSNFVVPPQFLLDSSVVVTVTLRGVLGRSVSLGRVTLGPYTECTNGTLTHWGKMLQDSRSVVKWRNLCL